MERSAFEPARHPSGALPPAEHSPTDRTRWFDGFTLVELLVVLAVIAVLATLLLPVLARARDRARQTTCLSNLRQIAAAHLLYLQDWDERLPDWCIKESARSKWSQIEEGGIRYWTEYLQPYLRCTALFHDPSAPRGAADTALADYALTTWGSGGQGSAADPHYCWPGPPLFLAQVSRPAETVSLTDGRTTSGWTAIEGNSWSHSSSGWVPEAPLRHGIGWNAGFLDGHAGWLPAGEFWRVDTDGRGFYWFHDASADR